MRTSYTITDAARKRIAQRIDAALTAEAKEAAIYGVRGALEILDAALRPENPSSLSTWRETMIIHLARSEERSLIWFVERLALQLLREREEYRDGSQRLLTALDDLRELTCGPQSDANEESA